MLKEDPLGYFVIQFVAKHHNKPGPTQVSARSSFLNMQRSLFLNFHYFLSAEKYSKGYA